MLHSCCTDVLLRQVARMREVGNKAAKLRYERWVPPSYRRVNRTTPQTLVEQWIFAKEHY